MWGTLLLILFFTLVRLLGICVSYSSRYANTLLADKPHEDPNIRGDAFKTLIVARLSYDATEQDLESEFGRFGPIERIRIVADTHQDSKPNKKAKKHRGYAFVVYEREKDMRGKLTTFPESQTGRRTPKIGSICHRYGPQACLSSLFILPLFTSPAAHARYIKYGQFTDKCALLALRVQLP